MKVSSPIGELPFTPRKLRFRRTGIEMEGLMGAWPAQVHISASDIPALLRIVLLPLIVIAGIAAAAVIAAITLTHRS